MFVKFLGSSCFTSLHLLLLLCHLVYSLLLEPLPARIPAKPAKAPAVSKTNSIHVEGLRQLWIERLAVVTEDPTLRVPIRIVIILVLLSVENFRFVEIKVFFLFKIFRIEIKFLFLFPNFDKCIGPFGGLGA